MPAVIKQPQAGPSISVDGTPVGTTQADIKVPDAPVEQPKTEEVKVAEKVEAAPTADESIDFNQFLDAKNIVTKPEVPVEKKEEVKTEKQPRDYSDIPDEDKALFERMSNDAFNKLKPIYLQYKKQSADITARDTEIAELKKGRIPDSYYENPNAVVLTPEFEKASGVVNAASVISDHWEKQFDKVHGGESTYQSIQWNDKGQLVLSEPIQVDKTTESKLMKLVVGSQSQLSTAQERLNAVIQEHKIRHTESSNWIGDFEKKAFGVFDKEENKSLQTIIEDTRKTFPAAFQRNPLLNSLVRSMVLNTLLGKKLQQMSVKPVAKPTEKKSANGNLSAAEIAGDAGDGKKVEIKLGDDFDDFKKYKEGIPVGA